MTFGRLTRQRALPGQESRENGNHDQREKRVNSKYRDQQDDGGDTNCEDDERPQCGCVGKCKRVHELRLGLREILAKLSLAASTKGGSSGGVYETKSTELLEICERPSEAEEPVEANEGEGPLTH